MSLVRTARGKPLLARIPQRRHRCGVGGRWRLTLVLAMAALALESVGAAAAQARGRQPRIQGGTVATAAWPATGALSGTDLDPECGGVLLSGRWFLTAGHCVGNQTTLAPPESFVITLGKSDLDQATDAERFTVDRPVDRHHLYFEGKGLVASYDLALLHLNRAAAVDPLRLVSPDEPALWRPGTSAILVGWGRTCPMCPGVQQLRQVTIPVIDDAECHSLEPIRFNPAVMVCAGQDLAGGCKGDSGGPLMVGRLGEPVLIGTTSGGAESCNAPGHPGMFTRLGAPALNQWLRERIPMVALTGTPAAPQAGDNVQLTATATPASQAGSAAYSWDLDGDGLFDDAVGPVAQLPSIAAGSHRVRVQTVYPDRDRAVAREVVAVSAISPRPRVAVGRPRLVAVPSRVRVRTLRQRGMSFGVACASRCSVQATLRFVRRGDGGTAAGTPIGFGRARATGAGTVRVRIKLTRSAKRQLRRVRRGSFTLNATVTERERRTRLQRRIALRR